MKEQNFAKLLRQSKFANFDPTIRRVYEPSPLPYPSLNPSKTDTSLDVRPTFWGFKRDLPPRYYGRSLRFAQLFNLDGPYGLCDLQDATTPVQTSRILAEVRRIARRTMGEGPSLPREELRIPGRVLNRTEGGYLIGIGGIVAKLPEEEIPPLQHFTISDACNRRAFYFYVKSADWDEQGRPRVILSMRSPPY